ncbi:MAG: septal ring lytic transglycosylase RlpA family protein [Sandarakinorhabdus sp.]|nr:septal ring lytic transglycosylase RlpA family protein [Sandarakinorhabdus sp.]
MRLLARNKASVRSAGLVLLFVLGACAGKPLRPAFDPAGVKIGKPYDVGGVRYTPADDRDYDQRGVASWYGPGFHALSTANGERYNQDDITAAHKTLPLPSWVEVENLDNGRKLIVRINDRGPFVAGRIIDLSRRSAQLLGVETAGLARVRVHRVYPDNVPPPPPPSLPLTRPSLPAIIAASPTNGPIVIQVAALSDAGRIAWLTGYLGSFGPVLTEVSPSGLSRIRLGPYADLETADAVLAQLRTAGYSEARLIPVPKVLP